MFKQSERYWKMVIFKGLSNILLTIMLVFTRQISTGTASRSTSFSRLNLNNERLSSPYKSMEETSRQRCSAVCAEEEECRAINHHVSTGSCEMIHWSANEKQATDDISWTVYEKDIESAWSQLHESRPKEPCPNGFEVKCFVAALPIDCKDILRHGIGTTDGVYIVALSETGKVIQVFCDMTTNGGGWTVFQKRIDGSVDFYRGFNEYENGFGSVYGEFWLGLKYIYQMTKGVETELRIDMVKSTGTKGHVTYQSFSISGPTNYKLRIGTYSGTAGNSLSINNGCPFSTHDRDVDIGSINCAVGRHGGWWYKSCGPTNLNGHYVTPGTLSPYNRGKGGVVYPEFDDTRSLKSTEIKFRRKK